MTKQSVANLLSKPQANLKLYTFMIHANGTATIQFCDGVTELINIHCIMSFFSISKGTVMMGESRVSTKMC